MPLLIIGDTALVGSVEIRERLPRLIEGYLAAGGVGWPDIPGVEAVAGPMPTIQQLDPVGMALAVVVMLGMVAALIYVGLTVARRRHGGARPVSAWTRWVIPLLAAAGLAVAGYLSYVEATGVPAVCGPVGDCNAVQSSPYARLFGVVPVALLGVAGYAAILATWFWGQVRSDRPARYAPVLIGGISLSGVLFSLYLTYLEPFVIGTVCAWCLTSAVIVTGLLLASAGPALEAIASR